MDAAPEVVDVQPVDICSLTGDRGAQVTVHVISIDQLDLALRSIHRPAVRPHPGGPGGPHERLAELLVVVVGAGRPDALQIAAVLPVVLYQFLRLPKPLVCRTLEVGLSDQLHPVRIHQLHGRPR